MIHVFFTLLDEAPAATRDQEYLTFVRREFVESAAENMALCDSAEEADLIVLLENPEFKFLEYVKRLEESSLLRKFPEKVLTLNYEDAPNGALAGLYSSLRPEQYCPEIQRSWPHVCLPNERIHARQVKDIDTARRLFSFRGNFTSHPVRAKLGKLYGGANEAWKVESIDRWYNHSTDEKDSYMAQVEDSVFALCPRGILGYTHRIGEVMALGRVPVIIADDWVPFSFEETEPYHVRIAEKEIARLPDLLRERRSEARVLATNARGLFERYLAIGKRYPAAVRMLRKIQAERPADWRERFYSERWSSRKFWQMNGWTLEQRLLNKVKKLVS
jgi:hypothetical protein